MKLLRWFYTILVAAYLLGTIASALGYFD